MPETITDYEISDRQAEDKLCTYNYIRNYVKLLKICFNKIFPINNDIKRFSLNLINLKNIV